VSATATSTLWDSLAKALLFGSTIHRLPIRLLVAVAVTVGLSFVAVLTTLGSGDYGPKGTSETTVVLGVGATVVTVLMLTVTFHGVRSLVVAVGGLGLVKELVARGEASEPGAAGASYLAQARKQLLERAVPQAVLWMLLGTAYLVKIAPFVWAAAHE